MIEEVRDYFLSCPAIKRRAKIFGINNCGGNWNNGVHDGSRAVNANNYPWNVNTNVGVWGVCDLLITTRPVTACLPRFYL